MNTITTNQLFALDAEPCEMLGNFTLYTYQTLGTGTGTVSGSNDGTNWVQIASFSNADSAIAQHSWRYLKADLSGITLNVARA